MSLVAILTVDGNLYVYEHAPVRVVAEAAQSFKGLVTLVTALKQTDTGFELRTSRRVESVEFAKVKRCFNRNEADENNLGLRFRVSSPNEM